MTTATTTAVFDLKSVWDLLFPNSFVPADSQFAVWLLLHDAETVKASFVRLAAKNAKLGQAMTPDYMIRFASSVMNRITKDHAIAPHRKGGA
jgi:hypothetical protein